MTKKDKEEIALIVAKEILKARFEELGFKLDCERRLYSESDECREKNRQAFSDMPDTLPITPTKIKEK